MRICKFKRLRTTFNSGLNSYSNWTIKIYMKLINIISNCILKMHACKKKKYKSDQVKVNFGWKKISGYDF